LVFPDTGKKGIGFFQSLEAIAWAFVFFEPWGKPQALAQAAAVSAKGFGRDLDAGQDPYPGGFGVGFLENHVYC